MERTINKDGLERSLAGCCWCYTDVYIVCLLVPSPSSGAAAFSFHRPGDDRDSSGLVQDINYIHAPLLQGASHSFSAPPSHTHTHARTHMQCIPTPRPAFVFIKQDNKGIILKTMHLYAQSSLHSSLTDYLRWIETTLPAIRSCVWQMNR